MDVCMTLIIGAILYCGFLGLFYYGFGQLAEKIVNYEDPNMKDARIVSSAQEAWYEVGQSRGGMNLEEYTAWYKQKDKFGQMDKVNQLISELDVPLDMLEGDFEYHERWNGDPASGMDAVRRIDQVIDKLVEIGDVRAVEPLIILAKKRETFRSESAIEALGNFDDKRSINYLVKSLSDKEKDIRKTAADALDKLGWEPE